MKVNDWIVITEGGYGTYPENVGCVCKIEGIGNTSIKIKQTRLNKKDGMQFEILSEGFRLATPNEIPEEEILEPNYEYTSI